ncbi:alpha/beta hydrolase [Mycobacterium sp. NPDC006124]|uniref:alpha/beta fold hydrolase n=1 Tax=Mycobacterium sp. NPDC006124 TaxID=3156729 RepID=UPI0033A8F963
MRFTLSLATTIVSAAMLATLAGCDGALAEPSRDQSDKPTVVLVHGAFADSSSWNGVVERLQREGYPVLGVANPLRGLHQDAHYVSSVLDDVSGPVVLVGHSYGGSVISEAAVGHPDVKALVYVASFILEPGESTNDLVGKFPGGQLGPTLHGVPVAGPGGGEDTDLYVDQDEFRKVFAADVPPEIADLMAATQRPVTKSALSEPATGAAWHDLPSWNMVTTDDLAIPAESMRFMGQRAKSTTVEIAASHAVTVSRPGAVADLIGQAARATES